MKPSTKKVSPLRLRAVAPIQAVPVVQVRTPSVAVSQTSPLTSPALKENSPPITSEKVRWWHSIGRSSRYSSFVFLGSGLVFMERLERVAEPVVFLWKNFPILLRALFYLVVPAITSAAILWLVPTLSNNLLHPGWFNIAYLAGFYITNAFAILVAGFVGRSLLQGCAAALDSLAQRGREAFPPRAPISSESKAKAASDISGEEISNSEEIKSTVFGIPGINDSGVKSNAATNFRAKNSS